MEIINNEEFEGGDDAEQGDTTPKAANPTLSKFKNGLGTFMSKLSIKKKDEVVEQKDVNDRLTASIRESMNKSKQSNDAVKSKKSGSEPDDTNPLFDLKKIEEK